jgi:hypothetical protein
MHIHDLHATILHLLGLDHQKLTYFYGGRYFRLTDVAGNVAQKSLLSIGFGLLEQVPFANSCKKSWAGSNSFSACRGSERECQNKQHVRLD